MREGVAERGHRLDGRVGKLADIVAFLESKDALNLRVSDVLLELYRIWI